ncbi:MAG: terminase large subunit domain-containing protein [bacterium]
MPDFDPMIESGIPPLMNNIVELAINPSYWSLSNLSIDLYDNQVEIIDAVCDLSITDIAILASRGSGKTYSVAIAIVKLCLDNPGFRVGIFGPKADTSKRLVKEDIIGRILSPTSKVYDQIDWTKTSNSFIQFKNGSTVKALSASPTATQESEHFHVLVLDEAHRINDFVVKEKLVPMLGSFTVGKTIKIGISLYKNNFWHSCNDNPTQYKVLRKPWIQCAIYGLQGHIMYQGQEFPKRIVNLMPRSVKEKYFPLQFADDGRDLWFDSSEGYTEIEWNTQYEMIWMEDINLVLSGDQHKKLASGLFKILKEGRPEMTERYYFGLDTASGTLMQGQKDLDWTVLTILRKNGDNTKDIVAKYMWQGDVVTQMQEIRDIVHPVEGIFKCEMGLADYSNIAIGIVEIFKKEGIPVAGVSFGAKEPITNKNYKNAMVDQFVFELDSGRVQYPNIEEIKKNKAFKEGYEQWGLLERHRSNTGINDKIFVDPSSGHDDHVSADILAVWCADQEKSFTGKVSRSMKNIPAPIAGPSNLSGMGTPLPGQPGDPNQGRFLKDRLT